MWSPVSRPMVTGDVAEMGGVMGRSCSIPVQPPFWGDRVGATDPLIPSQSTLRATRSPTSGVVWLGITLRADPMRQSSGGSMNEPPRAQ